MFFKNILQKHRESRKNNGAIQFTDIFILYFR